MLRTATISLAVCAACHGGSSGGNTLTDAGLPDTDAGLTAGLDAGCAGASFLDGLGKGRRLLVGASMADSTADAGAWDVRYEYIAGGIYDGAAPCASCATNCTSNGKSCANSAGGCAWWGCYQYDQNPPGEYVRDFVAAAGKRGEIPMFTWYELLQDSKVAEGKPEVTQAANDQSFLSRYLNDYRFFLQQIGSNVALVQLEPDFWGYGQQVNGNPHSIPSPVTAANATDCGAQESSLAGLGRCMIAMARKYAPNARVGLHGSAWAPGVDALLNSSASVDVAAEARKLAAWLLAAGAGDGDFVTVDASDRDAGYYQSQGRSTFWDATNATLPSFHQAFAWTKALGDALGKPVVFWQVPVGNSQQNNTTNHWKDNRVDYFFGHAGELADANVAGIFFGAGRGDQTTPETDSGNLLSKAKAYFAAGGQPICR